MLWAANDGEVCIDNYINASIKSRTAKAQAEALDRYKRTHYRVLIYPAGLPYHHDIWFFPDWLRFLHEHL